MSIHVSCPTCGAGLKAPDQAAGRTAKCPKCGASISIPSNGGGGMTNVTARIPPPLPTTSPSRAPLDPGVSPDPVLPPPVQHGMQNPGYLRCKICDRGTLFRTKKFRMSGPVVVIGFLLLIPSILGILFSILMLFLGAGTSAAAIASAKREVEADLIAKGVPKGIVEKVIKLETIPDGDLAKLKDDRRNAVDSARRTLTAEIARSGIGGAAVVGTSVCVGISSFIGGLLGWLLVMRKKVLQCNFCGGVVAAS